MSKYICLICGFVYDEEKGLPEKGIAPSTKWEDVDNNFKCPLCGAGKKDFKIQSEKNNEIKETEPLEKLENLKELSVLELSALCSNLAKGCEKQYLFEESESFLKLAKYFEDRAPKSDLTGIQSLMDRINEDLDRLYPDANYISDKFSDRGAKRALVWSEKVTRILNSILTRYKEEGNKMLENTNVYVCEICGFVYIGDEPMDICPVCKVPKLKIHQIRR